MWCSVAPVHYARHLVITLLGGCRTIYASIPVDGILVASTAGEPFRLGFLLIVNRWAVSGFCSVPRHVMMSVNV